MQRTGARARLAAAGQPVERHGWTMAATAEAATAEAASGARATVYGWLRRWEAEQEAGLCDRSSPIPHRPRPLAAKAEARICRPRRARKLGPHGLTALTGHPRGRPLRRAAQGWLAVTAPLDLRVGRVGAAASVRRPGIRFILTCRSCVGSSPEAATGSTAGAGCRPRPGKPTTNTARWMTTAGGPTWKPTGTRRPGPALSSCAGPSGFTPTLGL